MNDIPMRPIGVRLRTSLQALRQALWQDLRFAARLLARQRAASILAVLTVALGIGATTAIFGAVQAVLIRPLPYPDAGRLVTFGTATSASAAAAAPAPAPGPRVNAGSGDDVTYDLLHPLFAAWHERADLFSGMAAFGSASFTLTGGGEAEPLRGAVVTRDFLDVLGIPPALGRAFLPDEDVRGGPLVVVLGHGLWTRRFGAAPDVVGRTITLGDRARLVVGILPASFAYPDVGDPQFLVPMQLPGRDASRGPWMFARVLARLRPDVTAAQARAALQPGMPTIAVGLPPRAAAEIGAAALVVESLHRRLAGDVRAPLLLLFGVVGCVLLIACANLANLQLARAAGRQQEMAVRAALGAGRARLVRQVIVESLLVSLLGVAAALPLAWWGVRVMRTTPALRVPHPEAIVLDASVFAFAIALAILTGLVSGAAPAWFATRADLQDPLRAARGATAASGTGGRGGWSFRAALLAGEIACALMLTIAALLFVRSLWRLTSVDPGVSLDRVITFSVGLPRSRYPDDEARRAYFDAALARIAGVPGVRGAAGVSALPLTGASLLMPVVGDDTPAVAFDQLPPVFAESATPGYFSAMGIRLAAGRDFTTRDDGRAPPVAILNETLARRLFPRRDAVGRRIAAPAARGGGAVDWMTVIGIAGDAHQIGPDVGVEPMYYRPYAQASGGGLAIVVRTADDPSAVVSAVRQAARAGDPDLLLLDMMTMEERLGTMVAMPRTRARLLAICALLAIVLATIGVYGVMAHLVALRTREVGVRMALGARPADVLRLVMRQGLTVAAVGIALGLAGAFGLSHVLTRFLFGIPPTDGVTFAAAAVALLAAVTFATWWPARRAASVSPTIALRAE